MSLELSPTPLTASVQRVSLAHSSSQFDYQSATSVAFCDSLQLYSAFTESSTALAIFSSAELDRQLRRLRCSLAPLGIFAESSNINFCWCDFNPAPTGISLMSSPCKTLQSKLLRRLPSVAAGSMLVGSAPDFNRQKTEVYSKLIRPTAPHLRTKRPREEAKWAV